MANAKSQSFEQSLSKLESIVSQLESGELPLEHALEIFEDGVGLARQCQAHLADAERKVEMLMRERGELKTVPFDPDSDSPAPKNLNRPAQTKLESDSDTTVNFDDDIPF
jgi:exodeoxyribonuclease VII small subunit